MRLTRSKAIRAKCLDCSGGNSAEVRKCPVKDCTLYPFRLGREQKESLGATETDGNK